MRHVLAPLAGTFLLAAPALADPGRPTVWFADDGVRVRRADVGSPASRGENNPIWRPGAPVRVAALRGETIALQVVVEAGSEAARGITVDVEKPADTRAERLIEHYVDVRARSRNDRRPAESLGWTPAARPPDELGEVPDALVPVAHAGAFVPYPLAVDPRRNGAVWIDLAVSETATAGVHLGRIIVRSTSHGELANVDLDLEVIGESLPYRAASFLAYYDVDQLASRFDDPLEVEPRLWQVLHAHHVDALGSLVTLDDARRLAPALSGSLFTPARGYVGPGIGAAPAAVALGAYGALGEATPDKVPRVEALARAVPPAVRDVILYAEDEDCDSPRAAAWRRLLDGSTAKSRVKVAHTCGRDPRRQNVDVAILPSTQLYPVAAAAARAAGRRVWVYNGMLPRSGPMLLDAPVTSLLADGWIASAYDVDRWFLWETTFWQDSNRGGHGPVDPFTTAESFHNADGDAALGDGLLLYPGTQRGKFASRSLGVATVFPSIRLKMLRRGIQDAGLYQLARAAAPGPARAALASVVPAALGEVPLDAPTKWATSNAAYAAARGRLRDIIRPKAALAPRTKPTPQKPAGEKKG